METTARFDAELLRRYDRQGPRYTSYPTAPQFRDEFDELAFRDVARRSNDDPIPRRLSLYAHMPFCQSPCFYCGCNRIITRDTARAKAYLSRLVREVSLVAPLFDRDRDVVQLHLGGGTPNFFSTDQLGELVECLRQHFHFSERADRDISIELDPRFVSADDISALGAMGFNRASLGVQDFDPTVQLAVNRVQSVEQTLAVVAACRRSGFRSINIDLIYGLPGQNQLGFSRTLDIVIENRPDRLAVYSYAHLPQMFKAQRQIDEALLPDAEHKLGLLQLAVEKLTAAGYCYIGMDHFALPEDELSIAQKRGTLHRNFMGYTTHAESDLIGLGVSAISHVGDSYSQNPRDLRGWEQAIDSGHLPVWRGMNMSTDDLVRAEVIQQLMCQGVVRIAALEARHGIGFASYFRADLIRLGALIADGLVEIDEDTLRVTAAGRLLVRNVAACFDRYLHQPAAQTLSYSKAI